MILRRRFAVVLLVALAIQPVRGIRADGEDDSSSVRAPLTLSETGLYAAGGEVDPRNLLFEPQYPLWTDGAEKLRWIRLPDGETIDTSAGGEWRFPVGTKLWKEFAFDGRKIETRMLWRATADEWVFVAYVWNEEQSEAFLAPAAGVRNHFEIAPGVRHSIPGEAECHACHDGGGGPVLGFTPLQLSDDRDPLAIHGRAKGQPPLTIAGLERLGLLRPGRGDLVTSPPRIAARTPRERAVLGYFSSNCGTCHNEKGPLATLGLFMRYDALQQEGADRVRGTIVDVAGEWVTPGTAPGSSRRIAPGAPEASSIVYRMGSRNPMSQMPPLGTAVVDVKALELIRAWIAEELATRR
jgi:mono/diheme cytochrome c family protein